MLTFNTRGSVRAAESVLAVCMTNAKTAAYQNGLTRKTVSWMKTPIRRVEKKGTDPESEEGDHPQNFRLVDNIRRTSTMPNQVMQSSLPTHKETSFIQALWWMCAMERCTSYTRQGQVRKSSRFTLRSRTRSSETRILLDWADQLKSLARPQLQLQIRQVHGRDLLTGRGHSLEINRPLSPRRR